MVADRTNAAAEATDASRSNEDSSQSDDSWVEVSKTKPEQFGLFNKATTLPRQQWKPTQIAVSQRHGMTTAPQAASNLEKARLEKQKQQGRKSSKVAHSMGLASASSLRASEGQKRQHYTPVVDEQQQKNHGFTGGKHWGAKPSKRPLPYNHGVNEHRSLSNNPSNQPVIRTRTSVPCPCGGSEYDRRYPGPCTTPFVEESDFENKVKDQKNDDKRRMELAKKESRRTCQQSPKQADLENMARATKASLKTKLEEDAVRQKNWGSGLARNNDNDGGESKRERLAIANDHLRTAESNLLTMGRKVVAAEAVVVEAIAAVAAGGEFPYRAMEHLCQLKKQREETAAVVVRYSRGVNEAIATAAEEKGQHAVPRTISQHVAAVEPPVQHPLQVEEDRRRRKFDEDLKNLKRKKFENDLENLKKEISEENRRKVFQDLDQNHVQRLSVGMLDTPSGQPSRIMTRTTRPTSAKRAAGLYPLNLRQTKSTTGAAVPMQSLKVVSAIVRESLHKTMKIKNLKFNMRSSKKKGGSIFVQGTSGTRNSGKFIRQVLITDMNIAINQDQLRGCDALYKVMSSLFNVSENQSRFKVMKMRLSETLDPLQMGGRVISGGDDMFDNTPISKFWDEWLGTLDRSMFEGKCREDDAEGSGDNVPNSFGRCQGSLCKNGGALYLGDYHSKEIGTVSRDLSDLGIELVMLKFQIKSKVAEELDSRKQQWDATVHDAAVESRFQAMCALLVDDLKARLNNSGFGNQFNLFSLKKYDQTEMHEIFDSGTSMEIIEKVRTFVRERETELSKHLYAASLRTRTQQITTEDSPNATVANVEPEEYVPIDQFENYEGTASMASAMVQLAKNSGESLVETVRGLDQFQLDTFMTLGLPGINAVTPAQFANNQGLLSASLFVLEKVMVEKKREIYDAIQTNNKSQDQGRYFVVDENGKVKDTTKFVPKAEYVAAIPMTPQGTPKFVQRVDFMQYTPEMRFQLNRKRVECQMARNTAKKPRQYPVPASSGAMDQLAQRRRSNFAAGDSRGQSRGDGGRSRNCYNCGQPGHMSRECPEPRNGGGGGRGRGGSGGGRRGRGGDNRTGRNPNKTPIGAARPRFKEHKGEQFTWSETGGGNGLGGYVKV